MLLAKAMRYEEAVTASRELLKVAPLQGEGYLIAAHCHSKLGRPVQAAEALAKVERLMNPELKQFRKKLPRFLD